jgi:hypothetical protein
VTARYGVQHSSDAPPGQRPGVDVPPLAAQSEVSMQAPAVPPTEQDGGGVQHSMFAGPAQCPAVDVKPTMEAHADVSTQVPSTPLTAHDGAGAPLLELELLELELELLELLPPLELLDEELELELLDELELELLDDEPELVTVQHSTSAAPGQWPGVEMESFMAAQALVSIQTPSTLPTEQLPPVGGGASPPKSARAASAWATRFDAAQVPQIS